MRWVAIAIVMLAGFSARPAAAQLAPGTIDCKYDSDVASYFPDWPKSDLQKGDMVHVCTYSYDGHHESEFVLPPVKSRTGVCIVRSMQVYLAPGKNGHLVQSTPTKHWADFHIHQDMFHPLTQMQAVAGACPSPGDKGYIRVIDVPDGTFLELLKLWQTIIASPDKFDQNLALVPAAQKSGWLIDRLKATLTKPALLAKVHLRQISLDTSGSGRGTDPMTNSFRGVPVFLLGFNDPGDPNVIPFLAVDWVDGGFKVIGVVIAQV